MPPGAAPPAEESPAAATQFWNGKAKIGEQKVVLDPALGAVTEGTFAAETVLQLPVGAPPAAEVPVAAEPRGRVTSSSVLELASDGAEGEPRGEPAPLQSRPGRLRWGLALGGALLATSVVSGAWLLRARTASKEVAKAAVTPLAPQVAPQRGEASPTREAKSVAAGAELVRLRERVQALDDQVASLRLHAEAPRLPAAPRRVAPKRPRLRLRYDRKQNVVEVWVPEHQAQPKVLMRSKP